MNRFDYHSNNQKFPAYLFENKIKSPKAIVIYLHGGGFHSGFFRTDSINPTITALVQNQMMVYAIQTTGDSGYDKKNAKERGPDQWCENEIKDILSASKKIKNRYPSLPVFLAGFSHGAYLTNLMATKYHDKFNYLGFVSMNFIFKLKRRFEKEKPILPAVDSSMNFAYYYTTYDRSNYNIIHLGYSDYSRARNTMKEHLRNGNTLDYVTYKFKEHFYQRCDPAEHFYKLKTPILFRYGAKDTTIPFEQLDYILKNATERQLKLIHSIPFEDEAHGVYKPNNYKKWEKRLLHL